MTDIPFVVSLSNHPVRCAGPSPFDRLRANGVWVWRGQYFFCNEQPPFVVTDIPSGVRGDRHPPRGECIPFVVTDIPFVVSLSNHPLRCAGLRPFDRLRANGDWVWRGQYFVCNEQPPFVVTDIPLLVTDIPFVVSDIPSVVTDIPLVVSASRSW